MPNCWYIHVPIVGEFLPKLSIRQELQGRSAIFPPSSAPRHVLNCAWMDGECLACGDNGYLYMFQAFFGCTEMEVSWNGGTPKSSILIGFSIVHHPFGGAPVYGTPHFDSDPLVTSLGIATQVGEEMFFGPQLCSLVQGFRRVVSRKGMGFPRGDLRKIRHGMVESLHL